MDAEFISGSNGLEQIEAAIRYKEATFRRSTGSAIGNQSNQSGNIISLVPVSLPVGRLKLQFSSANAPPDHDKDWSANMIVAGGTRQVIAWRLKAEAEVAGQSALASSASGMDAHAFLEAFSAITPSVPTFNSSDNVLARARSALGHKTIYSLGGESPPISAPAWPSDGLRCDCSGFVSWCLRMSRKVNHPLYQKVNGGWFETTAIYQDGLNKTGFFVKVPKATPGCLLVYPDRKVGKKTEQGHVGIVLVAEGQGIEGVREIIHCSSSSYKKHGDAIRVTGPTPWAAREDSIIVRYGE